MKDVKQKIKRQIELLGLVLGEGKFTIADLAHYFNCEELTIKRDMRELRGMGIDIHSSARKGVSVDNELTQSQIDEILTSYFSAAVNKQYNKALKSLANKQNENSINLITTLQRSIENHYKVVIEYRHNHKEQHGLHKVEPVMFFQGNGKWRLLAREDSIIKQFILDKVNSVKATGKKFKKIPEKEIDELFENSFRSWIGNEKINVKLRLYEPWNKRIKAMQLIENQVITENDDGSVDLEMTVNSLNEIAGWVVSRGGGVVVVEPDQLRKEVIKLAQEIIKNYTTIEGV